MRILVAGRQGQLAQALRAVAPQFQDCDIVFRGRPELDLRDANSARTQLSALVPDVVINAAAYTAVDLAEAEPEPVFRVNAGGAGNLARAALEIRAAIIHVSTDYVFSGDSSAPYVESDPAEPVNVYGRSKLAGEAAVREANPRSIVARSAWLFSPWGSNFLKTMLELGRERDELSIVGDQYGSPTNAQDLALALLRIAATIHRSPADDPVWGIYHVANSGAASRFEQATAIFAAASQFGMRQPSLTSIASREYPAPARRPRYAVLNNEKFSTRFAMQMRDWREATRECVELLMHPD